jgi:putative hydrolase of the HAD superfamily
LFPVFRFPFPDLVLIRAVFLDAGATLLHPDPPVEEIYARAFAEDGVRVDPEQMGLALARAWEQVHSQGAADRYGGVRGEAGFWHAFLNRVRRDLDGGSVSAECFRKLASHFRDASAWSVFPDVLPTLDALERRGLPRAVVSNWDSYLPTLLDRLGLAKRFSSIVVSAVEQTGKPEPEIFRRACERMEVPAAEVLHVGDSLREDYEGARAAGLSALLLDRLDQHPSVADRIRSLEELPGRLDGL